MLKIVYYENHLDILKNVAPAGWRELWDLYIQAHNLADVPEETFLLLSEDQIESIYYFFLDLETSRSADHE